MFPYAFAPMEEGAPIYRPWLQTVEIDGRFAIGDLDIIPIPVVHGRTPTLGFRFNDVCYMPDVAEIPGPAWSELGELQLWIVDCFRRAPHVTHAHFERSLAWICRARPHRALLTHMSNDVDYVETERDCPDGVMPAYDGLTIDVADARQPGRPISEQARYFP